ncbi:hypothetical protein Salat_1064000 [Sesamum alatum]|uniref:CCHC-type domain-containing protein n=1 Tax=Sesamum alatum TaxID=300844 RepID=A0AAE1YNS5_9LAMI|nr:hypothetical protein Salat_1064000 [Sesamum alatum]
MNTTAPPSSLEEELGERSTKKVKFLNSAPAETSMEEDDEPLQSDKYVPMAERPSYLQKLVGKQTRLEAIKFNTRGMLNLESVEIVSPTHDYPYPKIALAEEYVKVIRTPWQETLILKLEGRTINYNILSAKINTMWHLSGDFELMDLGFSCYILKLADREKVEHILTEGPWMIYNHYFGVRKWFPEFRASRDRITTAISWVRIPELAVEYYHEEIIYSIAKSLGTPIKIDHNTFWASRGKFARLCVQTDLEKPVQYTVDVNDKLYKLVYENLPSICYSCGRVGHKDVECGFKTTNQEETPMDEMAATRESAEQGKEEQTGPTYGDWILVNRTKHKKSTNARKPVKENVDITSSNTFNVLGDEAKENNKARGQGQKESGIYNGTQQGYWTQPSSRSNFGGIGTSAKVGIQSENLNANNTWDKKNELAFSHSKVNFGTTDYSSLKVDQEFDGGKGPRNGGLGDMHVLIDHLSPPSSQQNRDPNQESTQDDKLYQESRDRNGTEQMVEAGTNAHAASIELTESNMDDERSH